MSHTLIPSLPAHGKNSQSPEAPPDQAQHVLMVDDEEHDVVLATRFLRQAGLRPRVIRLGTATAAIAHLTACIEGAQEMPLLVFVDLKMPGADGFSVLDWMRRQPTLRRTLTVVLSSSTDSRDVARAVALGAAAFLSNHPQVTEIRSAFQLVASIRPLADLDHIIKTSGIDRFDEARCVRYLAERLQRSGRTAA